MVEAPGRTNFPLGSGSPSALSPLTRSLSRRRGALLMLLKVALNRLPVQPGIARDVPVGFELIRTCFEIDAPEATAEQLAALREKTEQYCVVMQTLTRPPGIELEWSSSGARSASEAAS